MQKRVLFFVVMLASVVGASGQVIKPFQPRASQYSPDKTTYTIKGDFTVYCTITFDTRGGSEINPQYVIPGEKASYPEETTMGAASWQGGGDFSGWYADEALTQEFNFNNPITEDTTVYAKWAYAFSVCSYDRTNSADYDGGKYMVLQHGATEDNLRYGGCNFTLYELYLGT